MNKKQLQALCLNDFFIDEYFFSEGLKMFNQTMELIFCRNIFH